MISAAQEIQQSDHPRGPITRGHLLEFADFLVATTDRIPDHGGHAAELGRL